MTVYCTAELPYATATGDTSVTTKIHNGRKKKLKWQDCGFELRDLPSAVSDWTDDEDIFATFHPEVTAMLTEELGCDAVLFFPAHHRGPEALAASKNHDNGPVEVAHSDYTERYQAMLRTPRHPYLGHLAPSMKVAGVTTADLANAQRIATIQFWRNIGDPKPDKPLAMCDGRTVDRSEMRNHPVEEYGGLRVEFEAFLLDPPGDGSARKWYTFPEMTPDEVIMFRTYDSERAANREPFWTPHTAFADPNAGDDAPPRRSVELRAICMFS